MNPALLLALAVAVGFAWWAKGEHWWARLVGGIFWGCLVGGVAAGFMRP